MLLASAVRRRTIKARIAFDMSFADSGPLTGSRGADKSLLKLSPLTSRLPCSPPVMPLAA